MQETWVRPLGQKDPLEEGVATHSSILAWETPRTEEPGGATVHRVARVRHDRAPKLPLTALQCVLFCCTAKRLSHMCTQRPSALAFLPTQIPQAPSRAP